MKEKGRKLICDISKYTFLFEKASRVRDIFETKDEFKYKESELRLIHGIIEVLGSKTYISSNIDDLLWFWRFGLSKCNKVVDFGCGSGYFSYLVSCLGKQVTGYEYSDKWVGQDYSSSEYNNVFTHFHSLLVSNVKDLKFKFYNSLPLRIEHGSVDGVIMYAVLEHLDRSVLELTLKDLKRILRKNGLLFIGKLPRKYSYQEWLSRLIGLKSHENLFTKRQIVELLRRNGFKVIRIESTGLFFNHPNKLTNFLYTFTKIEKHLRFLPILHDYRLVVEKL